MFMKHHSTFLYDQVQIIYSIKYLSFYQSIIFGQALFALSLISSRHISSHRHVIHPFFEIQPYFEDLARKVVSLKQS